MPWWRVCSSVASVAPEGDEEEEEFRSSTDTKRRACGQANTPIGSIAFLFVVDFKKGRRARSPPTVSPGSKQQTQEDSANDSPFNVQNRYGAKASTAKW